MKDVLALPFGIQITDRKRTITALLLAPILLIAMTACTVQQAQGFVEKANQIIAAAQPAVSIIIALLPLLGAKVGPVLGTIQTWGPEVTADLGILGNLLTSYANAAESAKAGILGQIEAAITTTRDKLSSILPVLHVLDQAVQDKIKSLVNALLLAVQEVSVLAAALGHNKTLARTRAAAVTTPVKDAKAFRAYFNKTLHAPSGDPAVDGATVQLSL
jgi:hypothetical protein